MGLAAGTKLGSYEISGLIGSGGMGEVYRARDTRLHRDVALKLLPVDRIAGLETRHQLIREARAASALNHPNIVTIYDIASAGDAEFIVMEYVPGKTLDQLIPLGLTPALRIACQVASALAKAHSAGIIHRDIKPSNIVLTEDGTVKVLDFGLAKQEQPTVARDATTVTLLPVTRSGVIAGTPAYMSPEQAAGKKVDRRSDIFSFGLLLYEMLSGQRAFSGNTPAAAIEAIMRCQPSSLRAALPQVAPELDLIVMRCLDKEVSDRTQSIIDVKIALENILATRVEAGAMPSIAVLPFINMSADKENDYFADGLAEEIINVLAQDPDFKVIARTSSFSFRDKRIQIDEIAQKLRVEYVLEGGVRKTGSRIRVTVNLIKAVDGFQLWSRRFDSDMAEIFTVQDEIGRAVARELKGTLSHQISRSRSGGRTPNLEAYNAYLKGLYHLHRFTAADQGKAKEYFEEAIHLDPNYALGYSGLATYYAWGHRGPNNYSKIQSLLGEALELDPTLAEAHALRGATLAQIEYDWQAAEREFHKALTSASVSADVYYQYSQCLLLPMQRFDEALGALNRARQLDPLVPTFPLAASAVHLCTGSLQQAIDECDKALDLDDRFWLARVNKACALSEMGNTFEAMAMFELLEQQLGPENKAILPSLATCLVRSNREEEARAILHRLVEERGRTYVPPWLLASICYSLGNLDEGFAFINEALEEHDPRVLWLVAYPRISPDLRADPRFQSLLERLHLQTDC